MQNSNMLAWAMPSAGFIKMVILFFQICFLQRLKSILNVCINQQDVSLPPNFPLQLWKYCQKQPVMHETQKRGKKSPVPYSLWGQQSPNSFRIRNHKGGLLLNSADDRQVSCLFLPVTLNNKVIDCHLIVHLFCTV